jgi:hypothetical protein
MHFYVETVMQDPFDNERGLKFTKIDNEIRVHYKDKDLLLPINRKLLPTTPQNTHPIYVDERII